MNNSVISELELLSQKIENNTASLGDYKRYEDLLQRGGLTHSYIFSYLNKAGFNSWEELIHARQMKQNDNAEANVVGGLIGLGLGLLLLGIFGGGKK